MKINVEMYLYYINSSTTSTIFYVMIEISTKDLTSFQKIECINKICSCSISSITQ